MVVSCIANVQVPYLIHSLRRRELHLCRFISPVSNREFEALGRGRKRSPRTGPRSHIGTSVTGGLVGVDEASEARARAFRAGATGGESLGHARRYSLGGRGAGSTLAIPTVDVARAVCTAHASKNQLNAVNVIQTTDMAPKHSKQNVSAVKV